MFPQDLITCFLCLGITSTSRYSFVTREKLKCNFTYKNVLTNLCFAETDFGQHLFWGIGLKSKMYLVPNSHQNLPLSSP